MSIASSFLGRAFKLPPAEFKKVAVERDLEAPMPDGVVLKADHYYPVGAEKRPVVLIRSPYGRSGFFGLNGRLLAERGFQVLIQSCRGTFGSGGQFVPQRYERSDGLATVRWLKEQSWFTGEFATAGSSYLGFVQWAIAGEVGPALQAIAAQITCSNFQSRNFAGESFALEATASWMYLIDRQEGPLLGALLAMRSVNRRLKRYGNHLPLKELDALLVGKPVEFWRTLLEHSEPGDDHWKDVIHTGNLTEVTAPVSLVGGWYDIFLPWMLEDFMVLKEAGRRPYLEIGPWTHSSMDVMGAGLRDTVKWLRAHLLEDRSLLRQAPVRLFVMGIDEWRDFDTWPPENSKRTPWYLQPGGGLSTGEPADSEPDRYRYDPADPTPAVGGPFLFAKKGSVDNRALEARPDVLTYTSAVLERPLEIIGPVEAELFVRSSLEHTDFFVRLCDLHPSGKSFNICDGIRRLRPGRPGAGKDGLTRLKVELWPTAHCFLPGHRIRVQVSSGAHPRFVRNTGSGAPLGEATTLYHADQEVYHDRLRPSAIVLPVMEG